MAKGDEEISGAPSRVYRLVSPLRRLPLRFPDLEAALGPVIGTPPIGPLLEDNREEKSNSNSPEGDESGFGFSDGAVEDKKKCIGLDGALKKYPGGGLRPGLDGALAKEVVTGIALPSGSDKLYTASKDETLRIWDCASGQNLGPTGGRNGSFDVSVDMICRTAKVSKTDGRVGNTTNVIIGGTVADDSAKDWLVLDQKVLQNDIDINMLNPPTELEKRKHKLKRLVQSPNSFFMVMNLKTVSPIFEPLRNNFV
ncbi:hypothetical protein YC2023_020217 [Brassica napus]